MANAEVLQLGQQAFDLIARNTVAVLGPVGDKRSEWRSALVGLRNQAVAKDDTAMVALMDAILALLAADGDPTGIEPNLDGIHAQTWQSIISNMQS